MRNYLAIIEASLAGSIGKPTESREYKIEARNEDEVMGEAIVLAYAEGLEHVRVLKIMTL